MNANSSASYQLLILMYIRETLIAVILLISSAIIPYLLALIGFKQKVRVDKHIEAVIMPFCILENILK